MTFATVLALAVGLLVFAPVLAHLLRRGKTREFEFPPAHLVPGFVVTSEQRRRLEDRFLLLLRALMVLALAVLGATPFVQCSRLSVERQSGASVAMAIVLDDSQSMRAKVSEGERFELAKRGAEQLLGSLREGDAVALVLAGSPARVVLAASTNRAEAKDALAGVKRTDRATALSDAVQLARASLRDLPHVDKRVVVLSDLADDPLPEGEPLTWTPLEALSEVAPNCGIAYAEQQSRSVTVKIACNQAEAAASRQLQLFEAGDESGEPLSQEPLNAVAGEQRLQLKHGAEGFDLSVRLTGKDSLESDDRADVAKEAIAQSIAVIADSARASAMTGGPTVVEQALAALAPDLTLKPLSGVPEVAEDLTPYAATVIDDPPGLSPGARAALTQWLERGGVALALLGPAATQVQLAASLEPFIRQGAQWEAGPPMKLNSQSLQWLGPEASSLVELNNGGRVRLDAADLPDTVISGTWSDGVPFLFRRSVGRGIAISVGLPASVAVSDLALRPGFLAILDLLRRQAVERSGPRRSVAGTPWMFASDAKVTVASKGGQELSATQGSQGDEQQFVPVLAGSYSVTVDDDKSQRLVELDPAELSTLPRPLAEQRAAATSSGHSDRVDASPEWALLLLAFFALELGARAFGNRFKRGAARVSGSASA